MKRICQILFSSALAMTVVAACTKKLPYEEKLKDEVQDKAVIDTNAEYIYSSSMLNASRTSQEALPYSFSDNKRVKLEWTKDALRILETERDARYQPNKTNDKLVLEIPVEHIDYQCAKDSYGECTNKEEERSDVTWNQKGKFKFKLEAAKSGGMDMLPILVDKLFSQSCYEEVSSRVLDIKLEPSAINLQVERTFKFTNLKCLPTSSESTSDGTISAVYQYSMVKAQSVISKDFKPVAYPTEDQNTFGFFSTQRTDLDVANNRTEEGKKVLMNHWNPNRKEITYYLSDEFGKPENSVIKDLTYKVVKSLNSGLEKAGAQFRINLKEPEHKNAGDIRNSMIVLVEDPVASNVIGYGPQTEDPVTGEIISARTVMFLGTIKTGISYTYDRIVREKKRALLEQQQPAQPPADSNPQSGGAADKKVISNAPLKLNAQLAAKLSVLQRKKAMVQSLPLAKNAGNKASVDSRIAFESRQSLAESMKDVKNYTKAKNDLYSGVNAEGAYRYLREAKNCSYALGDALGGDISPHLASLFPADSKPWAQLNESEKQKVIDILLPEIWVPTLIHEMGHNLGLRHNFGGSEDKDNFYTDSELKELGIDHKIPFSTVMEYGDDLKALPVLGKYDIAALRYAYAGKVELADGKLVNLTQTFSEMKKGKDKIEIKPYRYCTDEHTEINAGCRRFDLGTTYTEIVENEIREYLDGYNYRNFRNGRAHMSLLDDAAYAGGVYSRFKSLRLMEEIYERIKNSSGIPDDSPEWDKHETPKDLKNASLIAGKFLASVLETPDRACLIAQADKPKEIIEIIPLSKLDKGLSCFNVKLKEGYLIAGQIGKSFQSVKDPESENNYADQIDVRGYWIDKLMAARALFARQLNNSSLDKYSDNYTDRSDFVKDLFGTLRRVMLNQVVGPQVVETATGETFTMDIAIDLAQSHIIDQELDPTVSKALRIPHQRMAFSQVLANEIAATMVDSSHAIEGKIFADAFKVIRTKVTDKTEIPQGYQALDFGTDRVIAGPTNMIAYEAFYSRQVVAALSKVERKRLIEIYEAQGKKQTLANLKEEEKPVAALPANIIRAYLDGMYSSPEFYEGLINSLPN